MTLASGTRLGPYEIIAPLGAGGMGEVYKARDTRLDRIVAVKVLPEQLAQDAQFRSRFELEARAISQLAHPNICVLHDVGEHQGTAFLVMEYLEGETLAERLQSVGSGSSRTSAGLPLGEALQIATQIASALDRAHRAGIVHRDLKPGNIFLTRGASAPVAKLLDFGLAKSAPAAAGGALSMLPTTPAAAITAQGAILGTFQYMAPEQIEGQEADARTDIFAFGAVLYEMLTGKRAFEGKTQATLIGAIMTAQPPAISSLSAATPPAFERLVRTCLAKDPNERYQSAYDILLALQSIGDFTAAAPVSGPATRPARRWRRLAAVAVSIIVAAAAAAAGTWYATRPSPAPSMRFIVATPPTEPFAVIPGGPNVAVSPDGRRIVYHVAQGTAFPLYLRSTDQLDARPISGADVAASPFFSPDSEWFGFYSLRDRTLKKIAVAGGPPTTLVPSTAMAGASWGDDGNIVFAEASVTGGLFRVSASGGKPERITTVDPQNRETDHTSPHVLPGSRAVVFTVRTGADLRLARIAVLDLQTGEKKVLVDGGFNAYYAPTGHLLYAQASTLMAVPFDLDRLTVTGAPTTIQEGIGTKASGVANYAVSGTGMFVYAPGGIGGAKARPVWVGRDGREIAALVAADLDAPQFPRISPDGRKLSLVIAGDLWVYDLEGRPPIKLTFDGSSFAAAWSPDGKTLVYESASGSLASIPADGSGRTPEQVSPEGHFHPHGWSPDGREIIAVQIGSAMLSNIVKFPPAAKGELQQVVQTESEEGSLGATLSHDGRWLAYTSDVTGRMEIWVRPFPGPGAPIRISPNGGIEPVWARNDRELYYLEGENVMAAAVTTQPAFNFKAPVALFAGRYARGGQPPSYAVAPDGRFLMIKSSDAQATSAHMVVVLNWLEELTRRVPGK